MSKPTAAPVSRVPQATIDRDNDTSHNLASLPKSRSEGSSFQPPPGYEIGGDAVKPHHPSDVLPVRTVDKIGRADVDPVGFQPPQGQIDGNDLPMGSSLEGMTDNVLGNSKRSDLESGAAGAGGFSTFPTNPSVESLNPSLVNAAEPPLPPGFCGRANGWER